MESCRSGEIRGQWPVTNLHRPPVSLRAKGRLAAVIADYPFDADFEGAGTPDDFAWFPAWALIADSRLAECLRLAQAGGPAVDSGYRLD